MLVARLVYRALQGWLVARVYRGRQALLAQLAYKALLARRALLAPQDSAALLALTAPPAPAALVAYRAPRVFKVTLALSVYLGSKDLLARLGCKVTQAPKARSGRPVLLAQRALLVLLALAG